MIRELLAGTMTITATTTTKMTSAGQKKNCNKGTHTKGSSSSSSGGGVSSPPSPTPSSHKGPKRLHKLEHHHHPKKNKPSSSSWSSRYVAFVLLCLVVVIYVGVALCMCVAWMAQPSRFLSFWNRASLANPIVKGGILGSSILSPNNHNQHVPTSRNDPVVLTTTMTNNMSVMRKNGATGTAFTRLEFKDGLEHLQQFLAMNPEAHVVEMGVVEADGTLRKTPVQIDSVKLPQSVSFQAGRIDGIKFYHCSTVYGDETLRDDEVPAHDIQVPSLPISRDMIVLGGKKFFGKAATEIVHGGDIRLSHTDIQEHAWVHFCQYAQGKDGIIDSIIALDLDHTVRPSFLMKILKKLRQQRRVSALPVAALVTPESSAQTVVDWIMYGDSRTLMKDIARHWIPVSAGKSIMQAMEDDKDPVMDLDSELSELDEHASVSLPSTSIFRNIEGWPILVVYGKGDDVGKQGADLLSNEVSSAMSVELGEGPLCYLMAAEQFITAVLIFLEEWGQNTPISSEHNTVCNRNYPEGSCDPH
jgi:hypothetical protein